MNQTNGNRGPIRINHQRLGQNPCGRRGTSDSCFRSCSASTVQELSARFGQQHGHFGFELSEVRLGGVRLSPDDEQASRFQLLEPAVHDLPQSSLHTVAPDGIANGLGYDETHASSVGIISV